MHRSWPATAGLVLAALVGCGGSTEPDPLQGRWLVDFGPSKGVLGLEGDKVSAACYPGSPSIGTYSRQGEELTLLIDFTGSGRPQDFSGRIVAEGGRGSPFRLTLTADFQGESLPFVPYAGDCSELQKAP